jgi:hypothetical protein
MRAPAESMNLRLPTTRIDSVENSSQQRRQADAVFLQRRSSAADEG